MLTSPPLPRYWARKYYPQPKSHAASIFRNKQRKLTNKETTCSLLGGLLAISGDTGDCGRPVCFSPVERI